MEPNIVANPADYLQYFYYKNISVILLINQVSRHQTKFQDILSDTFSISEPQEHQGD